MKFFEKIYIISLKNSTIRRTKIKDSLQKLNLEFEFFDAFDAKKIDINYMEKTKKIAYKGNTFYCTKKCSCSGFGHNLRSTSIANQLSHEKIWKIAYESKKNILILEDDVQFNENFHELINIYKKNVPKKWDLIYLSTNSNYVHKKLFNKVNHGFSGSHMYVINHSAAKIALDNLYPVRAHVDGYLDRFLIRKNSFYKKPLLKNCFVTKDKFGVNSSIELNTKTTMEELK